MKLENIETRIIKSSAKKIGLPTDKLFHKYYLFSFQNDLNYFFKNDSKKQINNDYYSKNPSHFSLHDLLFVWGHPFLIHTLPAFPEMILDGFKYFSVPLERIEGIVPLSKIGWETNWAIKAKSCTVYPEDKLDKQAPEFNKGILIKMAKNSEHQYIRWAAIEKLDPKDSDTQKVLAYLAKNDKSGYVRIVSTQKLTSESLLENVAMSAEDYDVRTIATEKLNSEEILNKIIKKDDFFVVREAAKERLRKLW